MPGWGTQHHQNHAVYPLAVKKKVFLFHPDMIRERNVRCITAYGFIPPS